MLQILIGMGIGFFIGIAALLGVIVWDLRHEMRDE